MLTPKKFFKKVTRFVLNKSTSKQSSHHTFEVPQLEKMGNELAVAPISVSDCKSPSQTSPSTSHSFVLVASDSSSDISSGFTSLSTGFDPANEQTVEFIAKVFNKVRQPASDCLTDEFAVDPAIHQTDSDSCDEDDSTIEYLSSLESINTVRPNRLNSSGLQPSGDAAHNSGGDPLAQIVRVLNAAKLRGLNDKRQAKKSSPIAEPPQSNQPVLPQIARPIQKISNVHYQQDFPELSTNWQTSALYQPPNHPTSQVNSLASDFVQKLTLKKPVSLLGAAPKPVLGSVGSVSWKPALVGDSLWKPLQLGDGPILPGIGAEERDEEEDYREANILIEKNKCHYCKLDERNFVIKCANCPIYFCNGKGKVPFAHILTHLKNSGHTEIEFELNGAVGNLNSCSLCNSKNIFDLGYISSSKANRYLLCRPPCKEYVIEIRNNKNVHVQKPIFKNLDEYFAKLREKLSHLLINGEASLRADGIGLHYSIGSDKVHEVVNLAKWNPLISDRCLVPYVIGVPRRAICGTVSVDEIEAIEKKLEAVREANERQRHGVQAKDLINEQEFATTVEVPVLLQYENGDEYCKVFRSLAKLEKAFGRMLKEEDIGNRYVCDQTCAALDRFARNQKIMEPHICEIILGKRTIESSEPDDLQLDVCIYGAPNIPELNNSQALAVKHSLENPLTLIQGPPGTGKTTTSASIVYHLSKMNRKKEQILVCAPSNIASDHLALKIRETGLRVVRLLSRTKEKDLNYKSPLSTFHLMNRPQPHSELAIFMAWLRWQPRSTKKDNKRLQKLRKNYERMLLNEADVICVTCVTAVDSRLNDRKFKYLLIDEVAQCTEPEVILPFTCWHSKGGIRKLILIGDIQQLSPVIKNKEAVRKGYDQSMMLRLVALGNKSFMLNQQYRMHPQLSRFSREQFYDSLLKDGVTEEDRILDDCTYKWPADKPMFFYSCREEEQTSGTGHSYLNRKEGMVIAKMVRQLVRAGVRANQIGIITPYAGHREHLRTNLKFFSRDIDYEKIEIESINAYQGREKDIIILSCVRSNTMHGRASMGFLGDSRRLNVALTRAKYGMIIVGDHLTLMNEPVWYELLLFYRNNNLIFKGDLENLEHFPCHLRAPKAKGEKDAKSKSNYFKSIVQENGDGEKTVQYEKIVFAD